MIHLSLTKRLYLDIHAALRLRLEACIENEDKAGERRWRRAIKWLDENWVEEESLRRHIRKERNSPEMRRYRKREKYRQQMYESRPRFEIVNGKMRKIKSGRD